MSFKIITDSSCDIKREVLAEWGIDMLSLSFRFTDSEQNYTEADMSIGDFYEAMRSGRVAKTAAVNTATFKDEFEKHLKEGNDIFYIGFSSGLSSTFSSGYLALESLKAEYPERKMRAVDTLAASAGEGLLVYLAKVKRDEGASLDELADYIESIKLNLSHWFTVEDLVYLKRGGRVSAAAAFFGNLLGIKPVLHVDNEGHLIPVSKVRGRRTSLNAILDKYGETAIDPKAGPVFISHADCQADVDYFAAELEKRYGVKVDHITDVGPVIGSHSGPGTFAFFFLAKER
ncbi:MAG: DegV family protein [Clostridia bacterium]|nr:DegV family protein [Clostridia bacterium]